MTEQWEVIRPGYQRCYTGDGCCLVVYEDRYDLTLPNGHHISETADSLSHAKVKGLQAWERWVVRQWKKGNSKRGNQWVVPLT